MECAHLRVLVDYAHPHGDLRGLDVRELKASDATKTRPVMVLQRPRCADCGVALGRAQLRERIESGDLHDARFSWSWS